MNRLIAASLGILLLCACASNPMMTGKPQHWRGKGSEEVRAGLGEPTRILAQGSGSEIWEYRTGGEFLSPGQERMQFGAGRAFMGGIRGTATTVTEGERIKGYENLLRLEIRGGKVRKWYAERTEGGRVVWSDH
jgi:hypothetical protein